jgi:hypothetical protein
MEPRMTSLSPTLRPADPARPLALAAAPTFALMALLAGHGASPICAAAPGFLPLDGMTAMYLLMSLFHLPPWLRLASRARARH